MSGLFAFIFLISLVLLPISLIKPDLVSRFVNTTRKRNGIFFGTLAIVSFALFGLTTPPAPLNVTDTNGASISATPTAIPTATSIPATNTPSPTLSEPTPEPTKIPTATTKPTPTLKPVYIQSTSTPTPQTQTFSPTTPPSTGGYVCNCAKTCPNLSCDEAQYQLNVVGVVKEMLIMMASPATPNANSHDY